MVPSCHGDGIFRMETMSMLPASTAEELIEYFTKKGPFADWFKNSEVIETSGVVIEFLTPMIVPQLDNILFVGGADPLAAGDQHILDSIAGWGYTVTPVEDDSAVPKDSVLREFIGGSVFEY